MPSLVGSRSRTIGSIPETRIREDLRPACEYASVHSRRPKAGVGRNGFLPSRSERFELFDAHRSSPIVASLAGENQVAGFRATAERAGVNMIEGGEIRRAMEPAPAGPDVDPAIAAAPAVAFEDEGEQLPASRCLHARSVCRGFAPVGGRSGSHGSPRHRKRASPCKGKSAGVAACVRTKFRHCARGATDLTLTRWHPIGQ
jgi:hypothetical protein